MDARIAPGQVIKGKYRVDRVLGMGGMGVVVEAHHVALDQRFAIKFLLPAMLAHPEIVDRFAREARAASRLESDHVARVVDVDTLEDGTPFMVMEFLEGSDLSTVRRERRPLPPHVAVLYLLEACEALVEAHGVGIVHRDLKPANLFLARRRHGKTRLKVLDFGISKMNGPGGSEASVTRTSAVMGSAEYMSPEQMMSSKDVDARADIWALGVTLYELLTATAPFPGETITHVCALVMTTVPAAPSTVQPAVPPGLDAVVMHCLEKDRERRFATVRDLMTALAPFAAESPSDGRASMPFVAACGTAVLPPSDPMIRAARESHARPSSSPGAASASSQSDPRWRGSPSIPQLGTAHAATSPSNPPAPGASGTAVLMPAGAEPPSQTMTPFASGTVVPMPPRVSRAPALVGIGVVAVGIVVALAFVLRSPASTPTSSASPGGPSSSVATDVSQMPHASVTAPPNAPVADIAVTPVDAAPPAVDTAPSQAPTTPTATPASAAPRSTSAGHHAPPSHATAAAAAPAKPKKDVYGDR